MFIDDQGYPQTWTSTSERHRSAITSLRGALFGIGASADLLSNYREQLTDQQLDELARGLAAEVRRVRTLLDGRVGAPSTFDLGEAIGPVIACARASGLDVRCSVPRGIDVHGIRDTTAQVVLGLLDNAGKHAPSSPVEVRARELCGTTALYVEDRGSGVAGSLRDRVFERGECLDDSGGSGLGLYVARRLMVRAGRDDRTPLPPRRWLDVRLALPACLGLPVSNSPRGMPPVQAVAMTARVLIVEDHVLVATGLMLALSARGWEVETTDGPTAADVIDHAHRFQPRCVLLDIGLGDAVGSGIDLIAPLRATGADVVMLTAETRRVVLASCLEAGAAGWIGKDAFLDEVVASLTDVLDGTPLIGCSAREAMIDELRIERAGQRRALSPFERAHAAGR